MKLNLYFKVLFLILFDFCYLNCEYLIFKKSKDNSVLKIDDDEHDSIYNLLLKYQWPTNIAYFDQEKNIAPYTLPSAGPLEEIFLRKKIQKQFNDIEIIFIPTSAYELFCLSKIEILEGLLEVKKNFLNESPLSNKSIANYIQQENSTISGLLDKFNKINLFQETKKAHLKINNLLVDLFSEEFNKKYLLKIPKTVNRIKSDQIHIFIKNNIINISKTVFLPKIAKHIFDKTPKIFKENIYEKIIDSEFEAHSQNYGLIYRVATESFNTYIPSKGLATPIELTQIIDSLGKYNLSITELNEFKVLLEKQAKNKINQEEKLKLKDYKKKISFNFNIPSRSISYGNSLFAGILYDNGACAFSFFEEKEGTFYSLKINKFSYGKKTKPMGEAGLLFSVPPLATLCSLVAEGEFFHPRSKSYYFPGTKFSSVIGLKIWGKIDFIDNINYFALPGNPIEMNSKLSDYIANNNTVFRPSNLEGIQMLIEGQKNVTALFKIINFIYKNKDKKS